MLPSKVVAPKVALGVCAQMEAHKIHELSTGWFALSLGCPALCFALPLRRYKVPLQRVSLERLIVFGTLPTQVSTICSYSVFLLISLSFKNSGRLIRISYRNNEEYSDLELYKFRHRDGSHYLSKLTVGYVSFRFSLNLYKCYSHRA